MYKISFIRIEGILFNNSDSSQFVKLVDKGKHMKLSLQKIFKCEIQQNANNMRKM